MHGILGMSKSDIQNVYNMWCADGGQNIRQEDSGDNPSPAQQRSSEAELQKLLNTPRPLASNEEDRLKSLLKATSFGEFAWNCYLARHRRFDEVVELSIPPNAGRNEAVLEYQQLLPIVKALRRNLPFCSTKKLSWPGHIKEAIEKFESEKPSVTAYESDLPIFNRGKTPVRLPRRLSKSDAFLVRKRTAAVALQHLSANSPQLSSLSDKSPPAAKRALMNLSEDEEIIPDVTIVGNDSLDETSNLKLVDYSFTSNSTFDHTHTPKKLHKDLDNSALDGHEHQVLDFDDATVSPPPSSPSPSSPNAESTAYIVSNGQPTVELQSSKEGQGQFIDEGEIAIERQSDVDENGYDGAGDEQTAFEKQSDDLGSSDTESLRTAIETQSDVDEVVSETQEDDMDATFTVPASPGPATGDFVSVCTESVTIVGNDSLDETSNLKLVDYSFTSNSTFDHTHTPKKLHKDLDNSALDGHEHQVLDFDDEPAVDSDQLVQPIIEECSSEAQSSPQLPRRSRKAKEVVEETEITGVVKKSPRRTPTRSVTKSKLGEVEQQSSKRKSTLSKAARVLDEKFTIPKQLGGIDAGTLFDMTMKGTGSRRRSLSESVGSGRSEPIHVKEVAEASKISGAKTVQTPTRQRRAASATTAELTPSRMSARKETKSPSRKLATTSSEQASSSVAKSPTRRTPTRSVTRTMVAEVEQESSKRESTRPKAAKALYGSVSSRSSRGRGGRNVMEIPATGKAQSPGRQRRAASATPVELTPSRTRTRKGSDSVVSLPPATPKSPSRRGRSSKIQPIPE
ncbi:hypothetical protein TELCIR_09793 [Teladorsagia circumcincta]|uniref:Uncharacterized protein n=1 Tax=Teladorsagia circumcincta TaxID=45464 RepID=A0A2G9UFC7_TELCI|nr:hypothetical protein TELCIR_09793 [Teladorsagia circumcincta]